MTGSNPRLLVLALIRLAVSRVVNNQVDQVNLVLTSAIQFAVQSS
jgi:hypothetical protein